MKTYTIPPWQSIAPTYSEAVLKTLKQIKDSRPFYNWLDGEVSEDTLRERPEKKTAIEKLAVKGEITLQVQMGEKYCGKSVKDVRAQFSKGEFGLGAYEVGQILLQEPALLNSYDDLWIDCAGDEYKPAGGSEFSLAPCFLFDGGELGFGRGWIDGARGHYGSASAVFPQSNLASGALETFEGSDLTLEARVFKMEKWFEAHGFEV